MKLPSAIDRLRGALIDPARRERAMLLVLALYVVLWTAYGTIAKAQPRPASRHDRDGRLVARSRLGLHKHPPLGAALVFGSGSTFFRWRSGPIICSPC